MSESLIHFLSILNVDLTNSPPDHDKNLPESTSLNFCELLGVLMSQMLSNQGTNVDVESQEELTLSEIGIQHVQDGTESKAPLTMISSGRPIGNLYEYRVDVTQSDADIQIDGLNIRSTLQSSTLLMSNKGLNDAKAESPGSNLRFTDGMNNTSQARDDFKIPLDNITGNGNAVEFEMLTEITLMNATVSDSSKSNDHALRLTSEPNLSDGLDFVNSEGLIESREPLKNENNVDLKVVVNDNHTKENIKIEENIPFENLQASEDNISRHTVKKLSHDQISVNQPVRKWVSTDANKGNGISLSSFYIQDNDISDQQIGLGTDVKSIHFSKETVVFGISNDDQTGVLLNQNEIRLYDMDRIKKVEEITSTSIIGLDTEINALKVHNRINLREFPNEFAHNIRVMVYSGLKSVRLQLEPDYLGPLEIKVHEINGHYEIRVTTATAEAQKLITSQIGQLHDSLRHEGLIVKDLQVSIMGGWSLHSGWWSNGGNEHVWVTGQEIIHPLSTFSSEGEEKNQDYSGVLPHYQGNLDIKI